MKIGLKVLFGFVILICFASTPLFPRQVMAKKNSKILEPNQNVAHINSMLSSIGFTLKISQFIARNDQSRPSGMPCNFSRDIGRAAVFITLKNHQEINQTVTIQNIEIRNYSNNFLQSFAFKPKEIELKPLENSIIDFHLTNKTGYVGQDRVKAIVSYQIGNKVNVIESEIVDINRH